ncbi:MAG: DUF72 domain-containing protein [Actinobacteria bacterium]|nr:DUF72 domain-containing protein [Actinomycetota bacterium]
MTVYVGTAGFSYKDWRGNFYPESIGQSSMLEKYSERFPVVEINSTYYAVPVPDRINKMALRTPADFLFTVKANRQMTHEIGDDPTICNRFRAALRPLEDHGKLGCVLAQFPWGFKNTRENRDYLEILAGNMEGIDTVIEFRNNQWETDETFELLSSIGLGYCCVDEPRLKGLMSPRYMVTSDTGYVRFHGRNYKTWWDSGRQSWERYDYTYSENELMEWVPKVEELSRDSGRTFIIFNNHYKGQAPTNARMFEKMLQAVLGDEIYVPDRDNNCDGQLFK